MDVRDTLVVLAAPAGVSTAPVVLPFPAELISVQVTLGTAGSTASTVDVRRNGTVLPGTQATVAPTQTVGPLLTKARQIPNATVTLGAAGAAFAPGTNVISALAGNDVADAGLATLNQGDVVTLSTALGTTAAGANVTLLLRRR